MHLQQLWSKCFVSALSLNSYPGEHRVNGYARARAHTHACAHTQARTHTRTHRVTAASEAISCDTCGCSSRWQAPMATPFRQLVSCRMMCMYSPCGCIHVCVCPSTSKNSAAYMITLSMSKVLCSTILFFWSGSHFPPQSSEQRHKTWPKVCGQHTF